MNRQSWRRSREICRPAARENYFRSINIKMERAFGTMTYATLLCIVWRRRDETRSRVPASTSLTDWLEKRCTHIIHGCCCHRPTDKAIKYCTSVTLWTPLPRIQTRRCKSTIKCDIRFCIHTEEIKTTKNKRQDNSQNQITKMDWWEHPKLVKPPERSERLNDTDWYTEYIR